MNTLRVKAFVDRGLGNSAYLIISEETGLAAVIDPQRDIDRYLQTAEGLGLRIIYALDTHLHADFVSGARELAARIESSATPLRIGASAEADLQFDYVPLREGSALPLGEWSIGVMATPGHTPEHVSYTVGLNHSATPQAIFSGGALIVGGAARTDLLGPEHSEPLAYQLYHTIHDKLLQLDDDVQVYPTHGSGSFCAAPASTERVTTIGRERQSNRFALTRSPEEIDRLALTGLPSYPIYYRYMRQVNRQGPRVLGGVPIIRPLSPQQVDEHISNGGVILDVRSPREFASGHITGAYGIPLAAPLITWAGWVVPFGSPIVLVTNNEAEREEATRQLIRIGYDEVRGYLEGGLPAWQAERLPTTRAEMITKEELNGWMQRKAAPLVWDVRFDSEWNAGHLPNAQHIEAGHIKVLAPARIPRDQPVVIHCGAANRATVSVSLLEQLGYRNIRVLDSGFNGWQAAGYEIVQDSLLEKVV